jgi:preprotein translocase subunit SecA
LSRISRSFSSRIESFVPLSRSWRLERWKRNLALIESFEPEFMKLSDSELRKRSLSMRYRAKSQENLSSLLPESFALVREAGRRTLNMRHFDVQMLGGMAMHARSIAEMQTGEGKTLTATLAMYLYGLIGKGAHLATVNDYLARRDAEWMRPIYEVLGMSVGVIESEMQSAARREAYACDVTYGTSKEFGFDFLRDRLLLRRTEEGQTDLLGSLMGMESAAGEKPVQREPWFALVDEADSVLIDDAGTPLIIGALPTEEEQIAAECYRWAAGSVTRFEEEKHYDYDYDYKTAELTPEGRNLVRALPQNAIIQSIGMTSLYEYIERAIKVDREYLKDRHYVIDDGEIKIVDEFTGRIAEGRKWRDGIHQATEAKEQVKISTGTGQAARVTVQDFFLRYQNLAGMTGTGITSASELYRIYKLRVIPIPTNRPAIRRALPTLVFGTETDKWAAVVQEARQMYNEGRPVLIGTRSIDKSLELSTMLRAAGVEHQVLNAHEVAREADIVSEAGGRGKVTVSTNMAGRGTDIKLGPGVADLGGLHVICTEMHDSARIDRQLIGRCGRQGDPGTYRQLLALDDDILLAGLGPDEGRRLEEIGGTRPGPFESYVGKFRKAQRKIESQKFRQRRVLLYHEKERHKAQRQMGQDPYLDAPG